MEVITDFVQQFLDQLRTWVLTLFDFATAFPAYIAEHGNISYIGLGVIFFIGFFAIFDNAFKPSILFFIKYLIDHRRVKLLLFTIIILSIISAGLAIKRSAFPPIDLEQVHVITVAKGLAAKEVEIDVTIPLEEELAQLNDIKSYTSRSTDNLSYIEVELDASTRDVEDVKENIRDALGDVANLAAVVEGNPDVVEYKTENFPSLSIGIVSATAPSLELYEQVKALRLQIKRVAGVATVREVNLPAKEIHVLIDRNKLYAQRLSLLEVGEAIRSSEQRLFAGKLASAGYVKNIQTEALYEVPEQIEDVIVRLPGARVGGNGVRPLDNVISATGTEDAPVSVGDVGAASWRLAGSSNTRMRFNGKKGFGLDVIKKPNADVLTVVRQVKEVIATYRERRESKGDRAPEVVIFHDSSFELRTQLDIAYNSFWTGLILILLTLVFFLGTFIAFWTTIGIMTSLGIMLIIMNFLAVSINSVSICAIIISLGILVDSAIIVAETIYKYRERGLAWKEAALAGIDNMLRPIFVMELTTIIGFACIFFVRGSIGNFATNIPIVVIAVLVASLIESTVLLPTHLGMMSAVVISNVRAVASSKGEKFLLRLRLFLLYLDRHVFVGDRLLKKLRYYYVGGVKRIVFYPYRSIMLVGIFFVGVLYWMVVRASFESFPLDNAYKMELSGEFREDASIIYTAEQVGRIEAIIATLPMGVVENYRSIIGKGSERGGGGELDNQFAITIILTQTEERTLTALDVKTYLLTEIEKNNIATMSVRCFIDDGGPPDTQEKIEVAIIGNDDRQRAALVGMVMDDLAELGLREIYSDLRVARQEIKVVPAAQIYQAGVTSEHLGATLRSAFNGLVVTTAQIGDERVNIRLKLDKNSLNYDKPLESLLIRNNRGSYAEVRNIVTTNEDNALLAIYRYNGERQNTVFATYDVKRTTATQIYRTLKENYKEFSRDHPGFVLNVGGQSERSTALLFDLIFSIMLMLILIYTLLLLQFHSFLQPFIIILVIPCSILGTILMFHLHGYQLGLLAVLGMLGAGGVVVKTSLVLIEFMNRNMRARLLRSASSSSCLRDDKRSIMAIVGGARGRFRPIVLTTVTTLMGIVFTAYIKNTGASTYIHPITLSLFWGVAWGMVSALILVPILYGIIWDLKFRFSKRGIKFT